MFTAGFALVIVSCFGNNCQIERPVIQNLFTFQQQCEEVIPMMRKSVTLRSDENIYCAKVERNGLKSK